MKGGMTMTDGMETGRLTMEARKKLTLTGATEVVRFDEDLVELNTSLGPLTIEGRDLKLKCLSPKGNQTRIFTEGLMLKLKLQYFGHLMPLTH